MRNMTAGKGAADGRPLFIAADDDSSRATLLRGELIGRYGTAYRVVVTATQSAAQSVLEAANADGTPVAVVLASQRMTEGSGCTFLAWVRSRHPRSKRAVLVAADDWGHASTAAAIRSAIANACVDHCLGMPRKAGDEVFHRTIGGLLYDWATAEDAASYEVRVREQAVTGRAV